MQSFVELVGGFVFSVQRTFGMIMLAGVAVSAIIGITIWATAPIVAEEVGDRVEKMAGAELGDSEERREAYREASCAKATANAANAWEKALDSGSLDQAEEMIEKLDIAREAACS